MGRSNRNAHDGGHDVPFVFPRKKRAFLLAGLVVMLAVPLLLNRSNQSPPPDEARERSVPKPKPSSSEEADSLIRQASENYFYHEYGKAAENYQKAIVLYEGRQDLTRAAKTYESLGDLYKTAQKPEEAEKHYILAADYHQRIENYPGQARAMKELGDLHVSLNHLDLAGEWYRKALLIFKNREPHLVLALVQEALGQLNWEIKKVPEAVQYFTQARDTFAIVKNPMGFDHMNNVLNRLNNEPNLHSHALRNFEAEERRAE